MLALAYKIMTAGELRQMRSDEIFMGSAVDIADGFIHLSERRPSHGDLGEALRRRGGPRHLRRRSDPPGR